jgi:RNA polymerase sigma-70 factor (ECF subfamily)
MTAPEETDERLVLRVAQGDRAAFTHLVARHRGRVSAMVARIVGDTGTAEDVMQEAFLRAWVKAPGWVAIAQGGTAQFSTWLSRVAVNLAIDRRRRRPDLPIESAPEPLDPSPGAEQALLEREHDAILTRAVAALPERQRAAIALTYDQGLSNHDGATAMGISTGAFELLLVRARRTLRTEMSSRMGAEA